jgi:cytidylate kinase
LRIPTFEDILAGLVIAIDGPSGSGKSTTARELSRRLGLRHIDTGAMYRAVTLAAMEGGASLDDGASLGKLADSIDLVIETGPSGVQVYLGDREVTTSIRTPEVTSSVSEVSAHPEVRRALVRRQRRMASRGGVVLEGRDIGSVVLPWADVKVYLVASTRVRAERRLKDLESMGVTKTVDEVEQDLIRRDEYDSTREASPLVRAIGAWEVDTSSLTIDGQVDVIADHAERAARDRRELWDVRPDGLRPRARRLVYRGAQAFIRLVIRTVFGLRYWNRFDSSLEEPYVFACNHVANVDPPFVGATLPREVAFVAKASLFRNPAFGWLIRSFNAVPIKRGVFDREAMATFVGLLQAGRSVMIFPEGGRVMTGRLGRPKSGVGYLALNSGVAVVPVYASGTGTLVDCMLRRTRMIIGYGRPIRVPRDLLSEYGAPESCRQFAEMTMHAIAAIKDDMEHPAAT